MLLEHDLLFCPPPKALWQVEDWAFSCFFYFFYKKHEKARKSKKKHEKQIMRFPDGGDTGDVFMSFLEARRIAGCPFTLLRHLTTFDQQPLLDPLQAQPSGESDISPPSIVDVNGGPTGVFPQPLPATTVESIVTRVDGAEE